MSAAPERWTSTKPRPLTPAPAPRSREPEAVTRGAPNNLRTRLLNGNKDKVLVYTLRVRCNDKAEKELREIVIS